MNNKMPHDCAKELLNRGADPDVNLWCGDCLNSFAEEINKQKMYGFYRTLPSADLKMYEFSRDENKEFLRNLLASKNTNYVADTQIVIETIKHRDQISIEVPYCKKKYYGTSCNCGKCPNHTVKYNAIRN